VERTRVSFVAGAEGEWEILRVVPVRGDDLRAAARLARVEGSELARPDPSASWFLDGVRSHERYTESHEKQQLVAVQPTLGRPEATHGVLIPLRKSAAWWGLAQDERRAIFEASSRHIRIGLEYLPAVARRLYHCRDLGGEFDFLTWFEYAPGDAPAFAELVTRLRATPEWDFVEREVEVHVRRAPFTSPPRP
jgi:chlorite dismutase